MIFRNRRDVVKVGCIEFEQETTINGYPDAMRQLARAFLDDPHWAWHAAQTPDADVVRPVQYARSAPALWAGAALRG
jgi:hypothetical protein